MTEVLDRGARDIGVSTLSGNWNLRALNSRCNVIEVCLVVMSSQVGLTGGALWQSSSEIGKANEFVPNCLLLL